MNENDHTAAPDPEAADPAAEQPAAGPTALYVRRARTPTLGFWLVLIALVSAVTGILVALLRGVGDASVMLNMALLSLVAIGMPLAGIAAAIDAVRNRRRSPRDRGRAARSEGEAVADHTDEQG